MDNNSEKSSAGELPPELPLQSEDIGFRTDEMIVCRRCERKNAPNRLKCIYCGADLEFDETQGEFVKPVLRKLDAWEKGFNLIYLPETGSLSEDQMNEIVKMTRLDGDVLRNISEAGTHLPVARAESAKEAEIVRQRLDEIGVKTLILSDEQINVEKPPKRLRGIEFGDEYLTLKLFNTDETVRISQNDLILIITGAIFERRLETTEKHNRKGENKILNASETASDETLLDIYSRSDAAGFRIGQKGFDFSCLGAEKTLLASKNIQKLSVKLKQFAPEAKLVENYVRIRSLLGAVWQTGERKDSRGLIKEKFGKFNIGNVTIINNLEQFTKFSRMLKNIL